jgi:hypothetical protein
MNLETGFLMIFVTATLMISCAASGAAQQAGPTNIAQQSKVPPQIWQEAEARGTVIVFAMLDVPFKPVGTLSPEERQAQAKVIAEAQLKLIAALSGTNHRVIIQSVDLPGIGLRAGTDALEVLEQSNVVKQVTQSKLAAPN